MQQAKSSTDFSDLETPEDLVPSKGKETREKFPCLHCGGSGVWHGGFVNPTSGKCHACNGKGYFLTSPQQRAKSRNSARKNKESKVAAKLLAYIEKNKKLVEHLTEVKSWNDFARSLSDSLNKYGALTEGQEKAAYKAMAKHAERQKEMVEKEKDAPVLDLTRINKIFDDATGNGLKRPRLRVGNLQISLAPLTGKNAGCLYVKTDGEYSGKITREGKLMAVRSAPGSTEADLVAIAADPIGKVTEHGRITGNCACCGRVLSKKESIERGIGPICADKFGF